ncbi:hypothetical protein CL617_05165 [archaeon]|nr:hypothetical protein [archaeon]|tara:strand:+ start:571 stop:789 length:219 start_codon:yes stop_codon:yes gene_type:complete
MSECQFYETCELINGSYLCDTLLAGYKRVVCNGGTERVETCPHRSSLIQITEMKDAALKAVEDISSTVKRNL